MTRKDGDFIPPWWMYALLLVGAAVAFVVIALILGSLP